MKLHRPKTYYRLFKKEVFGKQTVWEPKVWKVMRGIQGRIFLDIGANEGVYSLALRNHFKAVYAYEPNPELYEKLKLFQGKTPNIYPLPYAISNQDGKTMLYLDETLGRCSGSADTILPVFEYAPFSKDSAKKTFASGKGVMVETRTLDSLFPHAFIELVKIDVEGAEFLVLEGAEGLLADHRIGNIMVELHNQYEDVALEDGFKDFDYKGRWVDDDHYYAWDSGSKMKPPWLKAGRK